MRVPSGEICGNRSRRARRVRQVARRPAVVGWRPGRCRRAPRRPPSSRRSTPSCVDVVARVDRAVRQLPSGRSASRRRPGAPCSWRCRARAATRPARRRSTVPSVSGICTSKSAKSVTCCDLLRREVVREQIGDAAPAAVGHEVEPVADPHRVRVLADVVGERRVGLRLDVVEPDVRVLAALVALPVVLLVAAAVVGQLRAVWRVRAQDAAVHRHLLGQTAAGRTV